MKAACLCPQCGAALSRDAPQGLCPSCLLRSGLAAAVNDSSGYHGPFVPPTPEELARYFPQLHILELIGLGGMGAVYKARQAKLDRLVALKVLPPAMCKDPAFAERFTREARALARLCHPNIVAVHDFGEVDGLFFFLMEYVDGANLRHILETGRLTPAEALRIVPQVCEALQYAHEESIVHRDIKPENILLDQKGRVKVADFGLAKLVGPTPGVFTLTGSRQVVGTPHYMAPEQMEKPHSVDHRADIYSLGVVFYEMLTGELPLGRFALPSQKAPVDGRLDDVVLRALAKEPEQRFQRVSEVKMSLDSMAAVSPPRPVRPVARPDFVCIPFWRFGDGISTWVHGLLRWDGKVLALEMEIREYNFKFWSSGPPKVYREVKIPLEDLQSVRLRDGWLLNSLVLRGNRLNVLAGVPGSSEGQVSLYIYDEDLLDARQVCDETTPLVGRRPVPPAAIPVDVLPVQPRRGFLGRKWQSLVQKARYWMVDSVMAPRSVVTDLHAPAAQPEAKPRVGPIRRVLGATVFNSLVWAIVLCLVGVSTLFMPWKMTHSNLFPRTIYEPSGKLVTVYTVPPNVEIRLPNNLSMAEINRRVPSLRSHQELGYTLEKGNIVATIFGCLTLFLIATSSFRPGNLIRVCALLGCALAVILVVIDFTQTHADWRYNSRYYYPTPAGITDQEWRYLLEKLAAHTYYGLDAGPFVVLGLGAGLLVLGSWQLRCFFKRWEASREAAAQQPSV